LQTSKGFLFSYSAQGHSGTHRNTVSEMPKCDLTYSWKQSPSTTIKH